MPDPTLDDKIRCIARELALRRNVYPGWVRKNRMTQAAADREIAVMAAVLADLERERAGASPGAERSAATDKARREAEAMRFALETIAGLEIPKHKLADLEFCRASFVIAKEQARAALTPQSPGDAAPHQER